MNKDEYPENTPQWLKDADTKNAVFDVDDTGWVTWRGGDWRGGDWRGGVWRGGVWRGGDWRGGVWYDGDWRGGVWRCGDWHDGDWRGGVWYDGDWRGGVWHDGVWYGGVWRGGDWRGGVWRGGVWRGEEDRLMMMSAMCGIVFDDRGIAAAYRTTQSDGRGRHTANFLQPEGEYYETDALPAGSGTCCKGIHVTTAARAWTYFGIDRTAQMWRVEFKREDLLDCDGEKARIRGGVFTKIPVPFLKRGDA